MDFVDQQYWDESYSAMHFNTANDAITHWLYENVVTKHPQLKTAFEFGCFPCRYLSYIGIQGIEVSGMDLTPAIKAVNFKQWWDQLNIKTGKLEEGDVLTYAENTDDRYDLVCSFGFIEHFENFMKVIKLHDRLVKPNGLLAITTPNFKGAMQKTLHQFVDAENLQRHYLPSMSPDLWAAELERKGYEVGFSGYFGGFDFWHDNKNLSSVQRGTVKVITKLKPFLERLPSGAFHSPFCGIIAQKKA
jgi:L-malate glycosyltransferase